MIRILYFSTASAEITKDHVNDIVSHAAQSNERQNVTGLLAYNGRNFCQCLEGDKDAVHKLVDIIASDPRHSGFKVIDEKEIESRHFTDWSMKLVSGLDFSSVINAMKE